MAIDDSLAAALGALRDLLAGDPEGTPFADALEHLDARDAGAPADGRQPLPVVARLPEAFAAVPESLRSLADPLARLADDLAWTQTAAYLQAPPSPAFPAGYGYAVLAGPRGGAPVLLATEALACGVLVLGPGVHYPAHAHPAAEAYVPLTAGAWQRGAEPWLQRPAGEVVVHRDGLPHAMRAGRVPLLALYVWLGDLATSARFVPPIA